MSRIAWRERPNATWVLAAVVAVAALMLTVGIPASASAHPTYGSSHSKVITVLPNGQDDTGDLQAAFDACTSYGHACTVKLVRGTYYTAQIAVYGFQGSFVGAGQERTLIEGLPGLPSPASEHNTESNPFWTGLPGSSNPWPVLFTFVGGSYRISGMTLSDPYQTPGPSWAFPGMGEIDALAGAVYAVGHHVDASVDHVTVRGVAGPAEQDVFGYNLVNGIFFEGLLLPDTWEDPLTDLLPLSGTFSMTSDAFYTIANPLQFENLADARVVACFNTFDDALNPIGLLDVSSTVAYVCSNHARDLSTMTGIYVLQGLYVPSLEPSTVYIAGNDFREIHDVANAVWLEDDQPGYGGTSTLSAIVAGNSFELDTDNVAPAIAVVFLASFVVQDNTIAYGGAGVWTLGLHGGWIVGNEIRNAGDGVLLGCPAEVCEEDLPAENVHVQGNSIWNSGEWGIGVTGGSSTNTIVHNRVANSAAFDLYWDGTGSGNHWARNVYGTSYPASLP